MDLGSAGVSRANVGLMLQETAQIAVAAANDRVAQAEARVADVEAALQASKEKEVESLLEASQVQ